MTREMTDHQGMEVLSADECWRLLGTVPVGRIGLLEAGEVVILPVNFTVIGHRVAFRTIRGTLLDQGLGNHPVTFEADEWDRTDRTGWSVMVRGMSQALSEEEAADLDVDAWADAVERTDWVAVLPEEITGRRIVR